MAVLHARGQLKVGERYRGRSILGTQIDCTILEETDYAGRRAIVPEISGRAWIHGTSQLFLDPDDPFPGGYKVTDTWPNHNRTALLCSQGATAARDYLCPLVRRLSQGDEPGLRWSTPEDDEARCAGQE